MCGNTLAQSFALKVYTNDDGLPVNSIYALQFDSDGFLWVGTDLGITRFDGTNFKKFNEKSGLPNNLVRSIHLDKQDRLWIGTDEGVCYYKDNRIHKFNSIDALNDILVYSIDSDSSNNIWFATRGKGLVKLSDSSHQVYNTSNGFISDSVRSVYIDSKENLWVGTLGKGFCKITSDSISYYKEYNKRIDPYIFNCIEDANNNIWVGNTEGIYVLNDSSFYYMESPDISKSRIYTIQKDSYGKMWACLAEDGLIQIDLDENKNVTVTNILDKVVYSVQEDTRGDLWFGSFSNGLMKLSFERFMNFSVKDGLAANNVFAIEEDRNGTFWFGHYGFGISKFKDNKFTHVTKINGLSDDRVAVIKELNNGDIWVGTQNGLNIFRNGKIEKFYIKDGLSSNLVLSIFEDSQSRIWIGTGNGITLFQNGKFAQFATEVNFTNDWITSIYEDLAGNIWFGTYDNGALIFNGSTFEQFSTKNGLLHDLVYSITQDIEGNFWFATEGGLNKYDGIKLESFTSENGLPGDICYSVISINNLLYIGTSEGLVKLDYLNYSELGSKAFRVYNSKDNGIANNEMNMGAYFVDKVGNLWYGSTGGTIKFNPDVKPNKVPSPNKIYNIAILDFDTETDTLPTQKLDLNYLQNNIRIDYGAISFHSPREIVFKIMLDGIDKNWAETKEHSVFYRALPSGEYKFKVKSRNSDGVWNENHATVHFEISPPFWQSWWFITSITVLIMSFIYGFYIYKTRQVRKRNIELANMVSSRTKELEIEKDKSDELIHNILPASLVDELKKYGAVKPREFKSVSILFTDFKGFTYTSSVLPADQLVSELNEIFQEFDRIVEVYNLEKLKTIGDSYMAAGGLPEETPDHAIRIIKAVIEMQDYIKGRNSRSPIKWDMRVGVHSGNVIAGVVGNKKFTYDVWGDTVNIASRMESSGEPGQINISAYTYMLVKNDFECEYRGKIDAKGKGKIDMYFVRGIKNKLKESPQKTKLHSNVAKEI